MKHNYSEILVALAEGKEIEQLIKSEWVSVSTDQVLQLILGEVNLCLLRVKPETITINGITINAPETKPLELGQTYYTVSFFHEENADYYYWSNSATDNYHLRAGLIHLTYDNAKSHKEALLSFNRRICSV